MSARESSAASYGAYPNLRMMLAHQRVADLRRLPAQGRRAPAPMRERAERIGSSYRLPNGSWLHGRRSS